MNPESNTTNNGSQKKQVKNKHNILITGGAGFIGSNLVQSTLANPAFEKVRVLDNLSTGHYSNIQEFESNPDFEFIRGDIRDFDVCANACEGVDLVCHQAALGSVPRSIEDPIMTNAVNISGTLNVFYAAIKNDIRRVVYAASSSTYGDSKSLPKVEDKIGNPLSPYAVTKYVNELYARVMSDLYGLEVIGLRYFNVFGPKQDPNGAYAAVIPLFNKAAIDQSSPYINGDGLQSRDFTYIDNVVDMNIRALLTDNPAALNQVYNVACGERITVNEMWQFIKEISGTHIEAIYRGARQGDIRDSLADITKGKELLGYIPSVRVRDGLKLAFEWYKKNRTM